MISRTSRGHLPSLDQDPTLIGKPRKKIANPILAKSYGKWKNSVRRVVEFSKHSKQAILSARPVQKILSTVLGNATAQVKMETVR